MAFTREPSASRASTIGDDSSTRRPTRETMRSMICIKWSIVLERQPGTFQFAGALHVHAVDSGSPGCRRWLDP